MLQLDRLYTPKKTKKRNNLFFLRFISFGSDRSRSTLFWLWMTMTDFASVLWIFHCFVFTFASLQLCTTYEDYLCVSESWEAIDRCVCVCEWVILQMQNDRIVPTVRKIQIGIHTITFTDNVVFCVWKESFLSWTHCMNSWIVNVCVVVPAYIGIERANRFVFCFLLLKISILFWFCFVLEVSQRHLSLLFIYIWYEK